MATFGLVTKTISMKRHLLFQVGFAALLSSGCSAWLLGADDEAPKPPVNNACNAGFHTDADTGSCVKDIDVKPGEVAVRIEQARQTDDSDLQLQVVVGNGAGSASFELRADMFELGVDDGSTVTGSSGAHIWWTDGSDAGGTLAAGASRSLRVRFAGVTQASKRKPTTLTLKVSESGGKTRSATADVSVESCVVCSGVCTYTDRDIQHCGACGTTKAAGENMQCTAGALKCDAAAQTPCATSNASEFSCRDLQTDKKNCGACGVVLPADANCIDGKPVCPANSFLAGGTCKRWVSKSALSTRTLRAISGSSASNVWAMGDAGTALRFDGLSWTAVSTGVSHDILDVWVASAGNAWAVSTANTALRWNGAAWTTMPTLSVSDSLPVVWGWSANDVWLGGYAGRMQHWDGSALTASQMTPGGTVVGVWGASSTDVWAVNVTSNTMRWNGSTWTEVSSPYNRGMAGVWGSASNDVWFYGSDGLMHWNGSVFSRVTLGGRTSMRAMWGSASNDIWGVGDDGEMWHWDGTGWAVFQAPTTNELRDVWGSSASDIWAVGEAGTLLHFE